MTGPPRVDKQEAKTRWEREHKALPQRERVQECDAMGNCHYHGLQAALVEGQGLMFCKDCPDPHIEGSHSESPCPTCSDVSQLTFRPPVDTWESKFSPEGFHVDGGMPSVTVLLCRMTV